MRKIARHDLDRLSAAAGRRERLRLNLNLHSCYEDACQRMFNAVEPGSYIRPHRHLDPPKAETFVAVRGRLAVVTFTPEGSLLDAVVLGCSEETLAADVPAGMFHALLALEKGSIFFEAKPGPYRPLDDKDWAPWAPAEGDSRAADYLAELEETVLRFVDRRGKE